MTTLKKTADSLGEKFGVSQVYAKEILKEIIATIMDGLIRDQEVRIQDFGTFYLNVSNRKKFCDPRNGKTIYRQPKLRVLFSPCKELKQKIMMSQRLTS